jgi:hypothetical protein
MLSACERPPKSKQRLNRSVALSLERGARRGGESVRGGRRADVEAGALGAVRAVKGKGFMSSDGVDNEVTSDEATNGADVLPSPKRLGL